MTQKVYVYRNLNRKGVVYSLKSRKTGLVIDRLTNFVLEDCEFKVSQAGRIRVLRNQRKNVHAGIVGTKTNKRLSKTGLVKVYYNPYKTDHFISTKTGKPVTKAKYVIFSEEGVFAKLS